MEVTNEPVAREMQQMFVGYVFGTAPEAANGSVPSLYILNATTSLSVPDPLKNARGAWWQKGLYY